jgi:hypothetical protein
MFEAALPPLRITAATNTVTVVELGLATLAVVLFVALIVVRAKRDHDQKIRKAASMGYHDPDAARYVHSSVAAAPDETTVASADLPLALNFVAPSRNKASKRKSPRPPSPRRVPSSFGTLPTGPPRPVPAFDPTAAASARPMTAAVPEAPAPPPSPSAPPPVGGPGTTSLPRLDSSLPRLEQPPPPGGPPATG